MDKFERRVGIIMLQLAVGACTSGTPLPAPVEPEPFCAPGSKESCYDGPSGTVGVGACRAGVRECLADGSAFGECTGALTPVPERCDTAEDDDCNGTSIDVARGCECVPGMLRACYTGPEATRSVGVCHAGAEACSSMGTWTGGCANEVVPTVEDCATADDEDCDGLTAHECPGSASEGMLLQHLAASGNVQINGIAETDFHWRFVVGTFTGTLTVGNRSITSAGGTDAFLLKMQSGTVHALGRIGGPSNDHATVVVPTGAASAVIGGTFVGAATFGTSSLPALTSAGGSDVFVMSVRHLGGDDGWVGEPRRFGGAGSDSIHGLVYLPAGADAKFVAVGDFEGHVEFGSAGVTSAGKTDVWVAGLAADLAPVWAASFGDASEQHATAAASAGSNLVAVGGQLSGTVSFGGSTETLISSTPAGWVAAIEVSGQTQWARLFAASGYAGVTSLTSLPSGVVVGGQFSGLVTIDQTWVSSGGEDVFVAQLDSAGAPAWSWRVGSSGFDRLGAVAVSGQRLLVVGDTDGDVDLGGGSLGTAQQRDIFVGVIDSAGAHVASRRVSAAEDQVVTAASPSFSTGGWLVGGRMSGTVDFGYGKILSAERPGAFVIGITD